MNPYVERLNNLRALLKVNDIDFYIIPSGDPHLGEYVPDHWRIIAWLTGFTGSAGTVVVSQSFAGLWTDSRYFIQAEHQLRDSGFALMKSVRSDRNDFIDWLRENRMNGNRIGLDGRTLSIGMLRRIENTLGGEPDLLSTDCDLISEIWIDRPPMPADPAFDHPVSFAGKGREVKIAEVREEMKRLKANFHLLTSLDDIMWLLNIRGYDIKYCPLLTSFALIGESQILLFVDESKIPPKLAGEFDRLNIVMLPYEETAGMLSTLAEDSTILLNPGTTSASLFKALPGGIKIIEDVSIPTRLKAVKNKVEIGNIDKVMVKDGVALTKFFYWVEQNFGSVPMSELSLTEKINHFRADQENNLGPGFSTIIAYNEHAALPHYSATSDTDSVIGSRGIFLIDSGGQYLDGTTDITRTISFGRPTEKQIRDFTLVLKGTIGLAMVKFPYGTTGCQIDMIARKALWENGLNYGHGTGHGVGFCLNVHEGPQGISPAVTASSKTVIEPGMLISDEPGIYREGEYGIRIENLVLCYEDEVTEFGRFLKFDTVSLCYIDKSLIDISLLDKKEIDWLNAYHEVVYEKLHPHLTSEERAWLREKTEMLK
jgi:Xaa-Pro aminopeptidase